jgi:hypothetical protein
MDASTGSGQGAAKLELKQQRPREHQPGVPALVVLLVPRPWSSHRPRRERRR